MAELQNKIKEDLKEAMREGKTTRISTVRMLLSAIHNKEIELLKKETGLTDEEIMDVVRSESKKRRDAIEGFEKGGRPELAAQEKEELKILESYLPPEISDEELIAEVKKAVSESGAASPQDFGKVMKILSPLLKGKASGSRISDLLRKELGN
jgi:uncharacterized protein YqeY